MIPSSDLGIAANFPAEKFRNGIKFAMQMGAPNQEGRAVAFVRKHSGVQYFLNDVEVFPGVDGIRIDRDGKPLNPEVRMVEAEDELITVDCAVDIVPADASELPVGTFRPVKAEVTVLDVDYTKIQDCRELAYNGDRYVFGYEPTDSGLFDVDVHTLIFYALDES